MWFFRCNYAKIYGKIVIEKFSWRAWNMFFFIEPPFFSLFFFASHNSTETPANHYCHEIVKCNQCCIVHVWKTDGRVQAVFFTLRYMCRLLLSPCWKHVRVSYTYINSALKQVHQKAGRLGLAQRLILICTLSIHQSDFFFSNSPSHPFLFIFFYYRHTLETGSF